MRRRAQRRFLSADCFVYRKRKFVFERILWTNTGVDKAAEALSTRSALKRMTKFLEQHLEIQEIF